jgi:hypothetical protein
MKTLAGFCVFAGAAILIVTHFAAERVYPQPRTIRDRVRLGASIDQVLENRPTDRYSRVVMFGYFLGMFVFIGGVAALILLKWLA